MLIPAANVKHLMLRGYIVQERRNGVDFETGPNIILLSDVLLQNGRFANLAEFPVLQMLYKQGMIVPGHPGNDGSRPLIMGSTAQVRAQMDYLFRGNYGLASREELIDAGVEPARADELMRMKLSFAFGRIMPTEELVQPLFIGQEPATLRGAATIRRLRTTRTPSEPAATASSLMAVKPRPSLERITR